jgi:hypothetical protein
MVNLLYNPYIPISHINDIIYSYDIHHLRRLQYMKISDSRRYFPGQSWWKASRMNLPARTRLAHQTDHWANVAMDVMGWDG